MQISEIQRAVAEAFDIPRSAMTGKSRRRDYARPRQVAMYLARKLTRKSHQQVAALFKRDRTTVIHAEQLIDRLLKGDCSGLHPNRMSEQLALQQKIDSIINPEVWRPIPSQPGYLASSSGKIRHESSENVRRTVFRRYESVSIRDKTRNRTWLFLVHQLVAEAFLGEPEDGEQIRHLDGNPKNNHASNLCYGSAKDNAIDRERHGRTARGERGKHKLSDQEVIRLRAIYLTGKRSQRRLALAFNISQAQVHNIVSGKQRLTAA